jgi:hypothetical protein
MIQAPVVTAIIQLRGSRHDGGLNRAGHERRSMPGRATGGSGLEDDPAGDAAGGFRTVGLGCLRERIYRADLRAQVSLVD